MGEMGDKFIAHLLKQHIELLFQGLAKGIGRNNENSGAFGGVNALVAQKYI